MTLQCLSLDYTSPEGMSPGEIDNVLFVLNVLTPFASRCQQLKANLYEACYVTEEWTTFCQSLSCLESALLDYDYAQSAKSDCRILTGKFPELRSVECEANVLLQHVDHIPWWQLTEITTSVHSFALLSSIVTQCVSLKALSVRASWLEGPDDWEDEAIERVASLPELERFSIRSDKSFITSGILEAIDCPNIHALVLDWDGYGEEFTIDTISGFIERCGSKIVDFTVKSKVGVHDVRGLLQLLPKLSTLALNTYCLTSTFLQWLTVQSEGSTSNRSVICPHLKYLTVDNMRLRREDHTVRNFTEEALTDMICSRAINAGLSNTFEPLQDVELLLPWELQSASLNRLKDLRQRGLKIVVGIDRRVSLFPSVRCILVDY
jgi:hypothetical protein